MKKDFENTKDKYVLISGIGILLTSGDLEKCQVSQKCYNGRSAIFKNTKSSLAKANDWIRANFDY
jgi:hypothetical protein